MNMAKRGFTLVELLVVIAIIGLLSTVAVVALNGARSGARDAKRKADLRQISQAIELYSDANGSLPRYSIGWCTYISNPSNGYGVGFQSDIAPYLAKTPLDPTKANQVGDYLYQNRDNVTKYAICANLEKATGQSYDYSACDGGTVYNYCLIPNG
jgi:type II secretion system protein G